MNYSNVPKTKAELTIAEIKTLLNRLDNAGYPCEGSCVVFHAHSPAMPYHQHGRANTLGQAVRSIKNHDKWQLKGRPGEKRKRDFILQVQ